MKNKKIYISLFVCMIIGSGFIATFLGYQFPEWDKHRDWIFIPENEDAFFEIEKTNTKLEGIYTIPNHKGLLSTVEENDFVMVTAITEKGKIIKNFPKTKGFYIDSLNQRLIFSKEIYKSDTLFKRELISYRFSDYQRPQNLEFRNVVIEKDSSFFKTLYPVATIFKPRYREETEFYTNKKGELYTVDNSKDIQDIWNFFSSYQKRMDLESFKLSIFLYHPTYEEVEKPTIESNFLYTANMNLYFKQNEIEYYRIRFGNKYFNFKYKNKTENFPSQLNIPKSENDTLACEINDTLYWIYPKANKIKK